MPRLLYWTRPPRHSAARSSTASNPLLFAPRRTTDDEPADRLCTSLDGDSGDRMDRYVGSAPMVRRSAASHLAGRIGWRGATAFSGIDCTVADFLATDTRERADAGCVRRRTCRGGAVGRAN